MGILGVVLDGRWKDMRYCERIYTYVHMYNAHMYTVYTYIYIPIIFD